MEKILFIGNSHTYYNDLPATVARLYVLSGKEKPSVTMLTCGGKDLEWHLNQPQTAFNIRYGDYNKIIIQDRAHPFAGTQAFFERIEALKTLIEPTGAEICLYMTWPHLAQDYPTQNEISPAHHAAAQKFGMRLAPCGDAWAISRAENTEIEVYHTDWKHPSPYGSYLNACLIYRALNNGEPLSFVENDFYNEHGLDPQKCRKLMTVANRMTVNL